MIVYRICSLEELDKFLEGEEVGHTFEIDEKKNTHQYKKDTKYMHFFYDYQDIFLMSVQKRKVLCTYEFPDEYIKYNGEGYYLDPIAYRYLLKVNELAIESSQVKIEHLKDMRFFIQDMDFEDFVYLDIDPVVRKINKEKVKKLVKNKN